jgi:DNA-binding SARP family transcriptional activator
MFSLHLFGPPILECDGTVVEVGRRKAMALLVFLAVSEQVHSRDALATLFWSHHGQRQARANLRRALFDLNHILGEGMIAVERETIALVHGDHLRVDTRRFRRLVSTAHCPDHEFEQICSICLPILIEATELYRRDFLLGFSLADSNEFDTWQLYEADKLRRELAAILRRLVHGFAAADRYTDALRYARKWLALDPLEEAAHRELIRLNVQCGQRTAALRQYRECVRILESELGVEPGAETTELCRSIERQPIPVNSPSFHSQQMDPVPGESEKHEIRTVTVLSAGLIPAGRSGEHALEERVERARQLNRFCRGLFARYGARTEDLFGDDVLALFGDVQAHEDDAERAIRAALEIQDQARALALDISIGIDTGTVYLSSIDLGPQKQTSVLGPVAGRASRLRYQAGTGSVWVGEATQRQTFGTFRFNGITVESKAGAITAYEVVGYRQVSKKAHGIAGLQAELIGREEEMARLQTASNRLLQRTGQVVVISGEPGIGKTRLLVEFKKTISPKGSGSVLWLEGRCQELGTTIGYWPFLDILRSFFGVLPRDSGYKRAEAIESKLKEMKACNVLDADQYQEIAVNVGRLLSAQFGTDWDERLSRLDPYRVRHRTLHALRELFAGLSKVQPLILVMEDLHWVDVPSLDLLTLLMAAVPQHPFLLLCSRRPGQEYRSADVCAVARRKCPGRCTEITLKELSPAHSRQLVESLLHVERLSVPMKELVLDKSQGNPYLLEEVVRALIDTRVLYRTGRTWRTNKEEASIVVPNTLRSVIQSRVDLLQPEAKQTLQVGAVVGPVFSSDMLSRILGPHINCSDALQALQAAAFLFECGSDAGKRFEFKHILVQETVYQMIPRAEREALHEQVGEAIESIYAENLDDHCEQLASHFLRSAKTEKAIEYLLKAGERNRHNFLNEEAARYFQQAVELLDSSVVDMPNKRKKLEAVIGLAKISQFSGIDSDMEKYFRQAIILGEELGMPSRERVCLTYGLGQSLLTQGRYDELTRVAEEGLGLLGEDRESLEVSLMKHLLATETIPTYGAFKRDVRLRDYRWGSVLVEDLSYSDEMLWPYIDIAWAYALQKRENESKRWLEKMAKRAKANRDLHALATIYQTLLYTFYYLRGDHRGAIRERERTTTILLRIGDYPNYQYGFALIGWNYLRLGDLDNAEQYTSKARAFCQARGYALLHGDRLKDLSTVQCCRGRRAQGMDILLEALQLYRTQEDPILRVHGFVPVANILLALGKNEKAAGLFREALELLKQPFIAPATDEMQLLFHRALAGLDHALADPGAFRRYCRYFQQKFHDAGNTPFRQWYLEPVDPVVFSCCVIDETFADSLSFHWSWSDPFSDCSYRVADGLEIRAANGRSLWNLNMSAPRLLRPISGDFAMQTVCRPASDEQPGIGGLLIWKDRYNYIQLERGKYGRQDIAFKACLDNRDQFLGHGRLSAEVTYMRLERLDNGVRALCSADGQRWFYVGKTEFPVSGAVEVGVFASGWIDRTIYFGAFPDGAVLHFDSFQVWHR